MNVAATKAITDRIEMLQGYTKMNRASLARQQDSTEELIDAILRDEAEIRELYASLGVDYTALPL